MNTKHNKSLNSTQKSISTSTCSRQSQRRQLDKQYLQMREVICNTEFYRTTSRHNRIRFNLWSRKLDQIVSDLSWKRNRNSYIKLIYLMAQSEVIVEPFLSLPPEGELPFLRNYEINSIIDQVQHKVNEKIAKFGYCRQCLNEQRQRSLPFRLSTARIEDLYLEEEQVSVERITFCNHACLHQSKKQLPQNHEMATYEPKATIEPVLCSESNEDEAYLLCDQNEKENENSNMIVQKPIKNNNRGFLRQALQQISQNNTLQRHIQQFNKFRKKSSAQFTNELQDAQNDLEQHVCIPPVKFFHHFDKREKIG